MKEKLINMQVALNPENKSHMDLLRWIESETKKKSSFIRETLFMRMLGANWNSNDKTHPDIEEAEQIEEEVFIDENAVLKEIGHKMKTFNLYTFDSLMLMDDINNVKKNSSGLYVLFNDECWIVYVGKARDLRSRIHAHKIGGTHTKEFAADFYAVGLIYLEDYEQTADIVEKDLIRTLVPIYNVIYNQF